MKRNAIKLVMPYEQVVGLHRFNQMMFPENMGVQSFNLMIDVDERVEMHQSQYAKLVGCLYMQHEQDGDMDDVQTHVHCAARTSAGESTSEIGRKVFGQKARSCLLFPGVSTFVALLYSVLFIAAATAATITVENTQGRGLSFNNVPEYVNIFVTDGILGATNVDNYWPGKLYRFNQMLTQADAFNAMFEDDVLLDNAGLGPLSGYDPQTITRALIDDMPISDSELVTDAMYKLRKCKIREAEVNEYCKALTGAGIKESSRSGNVLRYVALPRTTSVLDVMRTFVLKIYDSQLSGMVAEEGTMYWALLEAEKIGAGVRAAKELSIMKAVFAIVGSLAGAVGMIGQTVMNRKSMTVGEHAVNITESFIFVGMAVSAVSSLYLIGSSQYGARESSIDIKMLATVTQMIAGSLMKPLTGSTQKTPYLRTLAWSILLTSYHFSDVSVGGYTNFLMNSGIAGAGVLIQAAYKKWINRARDMQNKMTLAIANGEYDWRSNGNKDDDDDDDEGPPSN